MAQFDVFVNPIPAARATYPFVVSMQSDYVAVPMQQLVAPVTARAEIFKGAGRLTPKFEIQGRSHVVIVPHMTVVRTRDLITHVDTLLRGRDELLNAVDFLFFGV